MPEVRARSRRALRAGLAWTVAAATLGGCAAVATPAAPPTTAPALCDAYADFKTTVGLGPQIDFSTARPEQITPAWTRYRSTVLAEMDAVDRVTPPELTAPVGTVGALTRRSLDGGDIGLVDSPEFVSADDAVKRWALDRCAPARLDVRATDTGYEVSGNQARAGLVAFVLRNDGRDLHEIQLFRQRAAPRSALDLARTPYAERTRIAGAVGGVIARPGRERVAFLRLEPGHYSGIDFIPEGSVGAESRGGRPHYERGMAFDLTLV